MDSNKTPRGLLVKICLPVLVIAVVCLGVGLIRTHHTVEELRETVDANARMSTNGVINSLAEEKVVVDPLADLVYLPEFRIRLPYDDISKTIAYSLRSDRPGAPAGQPLEADVISSRYVPPENPTRIDCSDFVRLKLEAKPHPYNPHEKPTSVKLADGRTLQVYELVNERECAASWKATIAPDALAQEFAKAQSY